MVKTYALDASALTLLLQGKTDALKLNELLKEALRGRSEIVISAVNFGEVYGTSLREHGSEHALKGIGAIHALPMQVIDATRMRAMQAAEVKFKYKLDYADSFAAALALEFKATLVTSDSDFRKLGHSFPILWLKP